MTLNPEYRAADRTLRSLGAAGVRLEVEDGQVLYEIPQRLQVDDVLEQIRSIKPYLIQLWDTPVSYRRALGEERCARCRELEARGVAVIGCGTCDVRLTETH